MNFKEYVKLSLSYDLNVRLRVKLLKHWRWVFDLSGGVRLSRANLSGADLSWANLSGADLSRADLSWANLSRANLSGADLSRADLSWANLSRANLSRANLSRADLSWANLSRANLSGANLSRAKLSRANLSRADLSRAKNKCSGIEFEIKAGIVINGLYDYSTQAYVSKFNQVYIRLGCHFRRLEEWESNFWNNNSEFPNDGSLKSKKRVFAYETLKSWAELNKLS